MPSYYARPSLISVSSPLYNGGAELILTDHGRAPLQADYDRIETRKRMVNGTMRSYFVAEKRTFSLSWENLPSRQTGPNGIGGSTRYTSDGYAAALQMKDFYEAITGPFTFKVFVDKTALADWQNPEGIYNVYFSEFNFSVSKRGSLYDLCSVSLAVEQV